ncbi:Down syndrome cell adhesion molecule [Nymphon striatum]|nr:Down syndrome cell adhesion molecule [Nymphon striatum]
MYPACTNIWVRDLGNYRYPVEKIGECTTQYGKKDPRFPPSWKIKPVDTVVSLNKSATFHCQASGFPQPQITWQSEKLNGQWSVKSSSDKFQVLESGSLVIRDVTRDDSAIYTCTANNTIGQTITTTAKLIVGKKVKSVKIVLLRRRILLLVTYNLVLSDLADLLNRYKEQINSFPGYKTAKMVIPVLETEDHGHYTCHAINEFGTNSTEYFLSILEKPHPPEGLLLLKKNADSYKLSWKEPYNGNRPIIRYSVELKWSSDPWSGANVTIVPGVIQHTLLRNLLPGLQYSVRVISHNTIGSSLPSKQIVFETTKNVSRLKDDPQRPNEMEYIEADDYGKVPSDHRKSCIYDEKSTIQLRSSSGMLYGNKLSRNSDAECYYDDISPYATFNLNGPSSLTNTDVELKSFKT